MTLAPADPSTREDAVPEATWGPTEGPADLRTIETQGRLASLGMLAAGIAHEVSNPLGFVKSNIEYVRQRVADLDRHADPAVCEGLREVRDVLDETLDGVRRLVAITAELRLVSRSGGESRPCDVEQTLDRALLLAHNLVKYRARVVRQFGHPPEVLADEGRLTQVFVNLLANAAQAIEGEGVITVATRHEDGRVEASVTDTGCGIPPDRMGRLFQPFFTTKPPGVGTGLGLWMVKRTVESFGGVVEVESEVGRGTTFRVVLPAVH